MSEEGKPQDRDEEKRNQTPVIPKKKRKTEPEVTIAPSVPGGPDVIVE